LSALPPRRRFLICLVKLGPAHTVPRMAGCWVGVLLSTSIAPKKATRVAAPSPRASLGRRTVCGRTEQRRPPGSTRYETKVRMVWGSFLIAAAALRTPTRNGYNDQGVQPQYVCTCSASKSSSDSVRSSSTLKSPSRANWMHSCRAATTAWHASDSASDEIEPNDSAASA